MIEELILENYVHHLDGVQSGVSYYGSALSLESETAIKHYFSFENELDVETLEITVDGKVVIPIKNGSYYEIKVPDIPSQKLGESYEVKVGGITLDYGVFSYGALIMKKDDSYVALKNTIKAMYTYNQAAIEYMK